MRIAAMLAGAMALASCSSAQDIAAAERGVAHFHRMLDAGQFAEIYESSAPDMRRTSSKERFIAFTGAVHRKLGKVRKAERQGFHVQVGTGGRMTTLTYRTEYEAGPAQETFLFRTAGADAKLAGYHINSDALITK